MNPAETHSKLDNIFSSLKNRIAEGHWSIGSQIPTEVELATEFGCSRATVSKAIAQLVHAGLVERRTRTGTRVLRNIPSASRPEIELDAFAFIYPSDQHDSIWRTLKGFQDAGRKAGRRVVMLPSGTDYQKEMELVGRLSEFDVKGAVVFPLLPTPEDVLRFSRALLASKLPIVLTEVSLPAIGCPTIIADAFHAACTVTRHLVARGLRRIGFLANYANIPAVTEEYRGYLWALEEAGLTPPSGGVVLDPEVHPDFENPLRESTDLGHRLLASANNTLDAVVCANDYLALGCLRAANGRGIRVPDTLRLASCNDYGLAGPDGLTLTTYQIPREEIGRRCFEMLDQIVSRKPLIHHEATVRGALVIGRSSG
ncbi:MAG: LacI family transcriptional regulator [Opitutaceae bacterium]|jgi:DNA-binding LacI/PurR family transcriptional regulator|nr:LacI family transcriptional regulator [Opitutaceae bacterium]